MAGVIHELKCEAPYFQAILDGIKNFELRLNDRGFQVGDKIGRASCRERV